MTDTIIWGVDKSIRPVRIPCHRSPTVSLNTVQQWEVIPGKHVKW